ncbi:chondroitin sulfate synthase 3-like [Grus americana]|uniref:chondroitin sulfate synthase 3-like n=1 Tax=Grus americana TaxID=9117 RepID=UPI0024081CB1|nr:chondroitin sulfate synthase 3-like [Grus americana]
MAARSRRPWLSVVLGLVLGFTAASWLIAPKVAELSEKKRRGSSLCSYYGRSAGPGAAGGAAVPGGQQAPPEAAAVLGGEPEEEEEGGEKRSGRPGGSHNGSGDWGGAPGYAKPRNFLYVGVMTAQKYLGSRAVAAQRTWAPSVPGRVEFFSSQGSAAPPGLPRLPVVALPGVDDSYPPQKKSFMMIKYMHDRYLDKYEWFMRADDDVYIKGDRGAPRRREGGSGAMAWRPGGVPRGVGRVGSRPVAERKGYLGPPTAPAEFASSHRVRAVGCCPGAEVPVGTSRCPRGAGPGRAVLGEAAVPGRVGGLRRGVGPRRAR